MTAAIAHLSDPHITTGPLAGAPAQALHRALGRILTLDPQPDCAVLTGDLTDRGDPLEYRALHEIISRFPLPLLLAAGNHDDPRALLDEFGGSPFLNGGTQASYAVCRPGFTLIVLNSAVPGQPGGRLGTAQLEWLDTTLARHPDVPAVVCVHHPPIPVGIPFLDHMRLADGPDFGAVLTRHAHVARVMCGHVHRSVTAAFAGTTLTIAPSTYLQSGLALRGGTPDYLPEPTSVLLHVSGDPAWVTHTVPVSHAAAAVAIF